MKYPRSVYVAASSADSDRAKRMMDLVRAAGLTVTSTWLEVIASNAGIANPRDAETQQRFGWSFDDLRQIDSCDLLWFLVPPGDKPTRGAWLEAGYAHGKGKLLVSSGDTKQSIFCALGAEHEDDLDAFAQICKLAREGHS